MTDGTAINLDEATDSTLKQKNKNLNDGGFSNILYGVLEAVGKWRQEDIFIEALPPGIVDTVTKVFSSFQKENEETKEALKEFLRTAIGETAAGASSNSPGGSGNGTLAGENIKIKGAKASAEQIKNLEAGLGYAYDLYENPPDNAVLALIEAGTQESEWINIATPSEDGYGSYGILQGLERYNPKSDLMNIGFNVRVFMGGDPAPAKFKNGDNGKHGWTGKGSAIELAKKNPGMSPGVIAQTVEGSAYPDRYDNGAGGLIEARNTLAAWKRGAAKNKNKTQDVAQPGGGQSGNGRTPDGNSRSAKVASVSINDMIGRDIVDAATTVIDSSIPVARRSSRTVSAAARPIAPSLPGAVPPQPNQSGKGPTPSTQSPKAPSNSNKPLWPVPTGIKAGSGFGTQRVGHLHEGLDFPCPNGTDIFAVLDGTANIVQDDGGTGYGKWIELKHANNVFTRYGHLQSWNVKAGDKVKKGDVIAKSNNTGGSSGPHLHFEYRPGGVAQDAAPWLAGADTQAGGTDPASASGISGGGISKEAAQGIATASAFGTVIELPTMAETLESLAYSGQKSYMNDKPLIDFVEQLCSASMRTYMSLPDGRFYAFFPDHFGTFNPNRPPYWEIDDVELIEGDMILSDENLKTHVYVVGDTQYDMKIDFNDRLMTSGIVTIFNAFETNWLLSQQGGKGKLPLFKDAANFLNRYGVRPDYHEEPLIRSKYFEAFSAFQRFMQQWSLQFITQFQFTFMPELYPGGRVAFKDHDLVCYIDSVQHQFDYAGGFETFAQLSSPSAKDTNDDGMMEKFTYGMVKSF